MVNTLPEKRTWMCLLFCTRINLNVLLGLVLLGFLATAGVSRAEPYADFAVRLVSNPPGGVTFRPDLEALLFNEVNTLRAKERFKQLSAIKQGDLVTAARAHALDLLQQNAMGHRSSTGYDFESRMRSFNPGVTFMARMGENAARERSKGPADETKARRLFQQWVKSRSHRQALLSRDYVRVATGVVQKGDTLYAVQIFSGPEVNSNLFRSGSPDNQSGGKAEASGSLY